MEMMQWNIAKVAGAGGYVVRDAHDQQVRARIVNTLERVVDRQNWRITFPTAPMFDNDLPSLDQAIGYVRGVERAVRAAGIAVSVLTRLRTG